MRGALFALALAASPAAALDLPFPAPAELMAEVDEAGAAVMLATGNWTEGGLPQMTLEGDALQRSWRIEGDFTSLAVMGALRDAVESAGFRILHQCAARECGGFDFRYAIPLLPEPFMHVDLGDYRYLSARKGEAGLAVMVSRSAAAVHVEVTEVTAANASAAVPTVPSATTSTAPTPTASPAPPATGIAAGLQQDGRVVLEDLAFASGAGALLPGDYPSLAALADWLAANPEARIVLVGHTDASGGLAGNVALSKQRAASVRAALLAVPGVQAAQVGAEGVGYLAPRAPNQTEEGRQKNRRVEAVLASTK